MRRDRKRVSRHRLRDRLSRAFGIPRRFSPLRPCAQSDRGGGGGVRPTGRWNNNIVIAAVGRFSRYKYVKYSLKPRVAVTTAVYGARADGVNK